MVRCDGGKGSRKWRKTSPSWHHADEGTSSLEGVVNPRLRDLHVAEGRSPWGAQTRRRNGRGAMRATRRSSIAAALLAIAACSAPTEQNASSPADATPTGDGSVEAQADTDWYAREAAASDPATAPEILTELAQDGDGSIRGAVARNPAAPAEVLAQLARDPISAAVREAVAANPSTPAETLDLLARDESDDVRRSAERSLEALAQGARPDEDAGPASADPEEMSEASSADSSEADGASDPGRAYTQLDAESLGLLPSDEEYVAALMDAWGRFTPADRAEACREYLADPEAATAALQRGLPRGFPDEVVPAFLSEQCR